MQKRKKLFAAISIYLSIFAFSAFANHSLAQTGGISEQNEEVIVVAEEGGLVPEASGASDCTRNGRSASECGDYTVTDIVGMSITIANWIFGIVGSLTLLMFVYGGFMFLISAGSNDKVSSAKKIISAAVTGLIIVFASYLIINFILGNLLGVEFTGVLPS